MIYSISDEHIRRYYPNVLHPAKGEQPLSEKLLPYLEAAERWVIDTFVGDLTYRLIIDSHKDLFEIAVSIIIHEGMRCAIPEFDLILTPNGFGIVSNNTIAPASKERVERLIYQSIENRDLAIEALLRHIVRVEEWRESDQCKFFGSTFYPNIDICQKVGLRSNKWEEYLKLREKMLIVEEKLAVQFLSRSLMNALRYELISSYNMENTSRRHVVQVIRAYIADILRGDGPDVKIIIDLVDYIRNDFEDFIEWHASDTAMLFSPPVFENKKTSGGYFF